MEQEEGCFAATFERKYYHCQGVFIKRSLRPREFRTGHAGLHVPRLGNETLKNEAACMRYIHEHTKIPVPQLYCDFEDDEAHYLVMEYVEGESMSSLREDQKLVVQEELQKHLAVLRTLRSTRMGGPTGIVIPPYRVERQTASDDWQLRSSNVDDFVICHNDLSQHNIVVDPDTLKINAILDWEYGGFFPSNFEMHFFNRPGPSVALGNELDDSLELLQLLESWRSSEDHEQANQADV
jgi:aminoglycoside phosphotransferase (APT) family kinase protein